MGLEAKCVLSCPQVGEGNLAVQEAELHQLKQVGFTTQASFLTYSAFLARMFHKSMSSSAESSQEYSQNGEWKRKLAKIPLGLMLGMEFALRNPGQFDYLIGSQEHQFGALPRSYWQYKASDRYLVVGDVEPKDSAIEIAQDKGFTLAVWTKQAYDRLSAMGVRAILIAPPLPFSFAEGRQIADTKGEQILVKSSGSGMPEVYQKRLRGALDALGVPYRIVLPEIIITEQGEIPRANTIEQKIKEYYDEILLNPAALTIAYPSEQTMVEAALKRGFVAIPPRGPHEVKNLEWAKRHGVLLSTIDPKNDSDLIKPIERAYQQARKYQNDGIEAHMGTTNLADILVQRTNRSQLLAVAA